MSKFTPSKHQKDIFNFILKDDKNAVISAVAGSGKTTTLIKALEIIPDNKSVLFLAFNKSISNELKERVPKNKLIDVKTVHGFGYSILNSHNNPAIDNGKYRKLFRDIVQFFSGKDDNILKQYDFDEEHMGYVKQMAKSVINDELDVNQFTADVNTLSNLGRLHLVNFDIKPIGVSDIRTLSNIHSINNEDGECEVAWYLSKLGLYNTRTIDYTDMIVLPNLNKHDVPKYDFVFIDECQDLNTCQRLLMQQAIKPETGRFIAVGDPKQAIYAFAGADYESYMKLKEIPNTIELPLSVTYRCATPIVDMVKHINPFIKPHTKNKSGTVIENFSYKDIQDGDMILCRNTFPIVSLCIRLLGEGKKAHIIGSDIGLSLKTMILGCERKSEEFTMENVFSRLYHDKDKLVEKVMTNHGMTKGEAMEENSVVMYSEKVQVIEALGNGLTNPHDVIKKIDDLFSDSKKTGVCLSNIHKSKGLEAERVFILHRELLPSKYAKLPWQIEQENNLEYVAFTRAKTTLGFITDFDAWASHKSQTDKVKKVNESKHLGSPGAKLYFELRVIDRREFTGPYGDSVIYEMVDNKGNIVSRFGEIKKDYLISDEDDVEVGSRVSFYGLIKEHTSFKGNKITRLGKIMKY
jgi:superfamily I DNA/RNA helicase